MSIVEPINTLYFQIPLKPQQQQLQKNESIRHALVTIRLSDIAWPPNHHHCHAVVLCEATYRSFGSVAARWKRMCF